MYGRITLDMLGKAKADTREPRSRHEIAGFLEMLSVYHAVRKYIKPLLESGKLVMTLPDKPQSSNQRYIATRVS